MHAPKKIVISHVYSSDNKGDAALTSVLIEDLKRVFRGVSITILRFESVEKDSYFEGVPEKPSFMHYVTNKYQNPLLKLIYALYMMSATLLWAISHRLTRHSLYLPKHLHEVAQTYEQADLIVAVGGGYIRSRPGLINRFNIPLVLHPLLFGHLLGKPAVLYSQSVGPFVNAYELPLVAFVLKRMALILLREDISVALLARMGVTQNVMRAIDSGFLLRSKGKAHVRRKYHIAADKMIVGVTVRSWLAGKAQTRYERAVAEVLDDLIEHFQAYVLFIPQVTAAKGDDDRQASHRVHDYIRHPKSATVIAGTPDHHQIKAIYNELDILLGTRFHSVIFSLSSFVPVLAIEYEHKTSGIMHDLKLGQWVIKIEDATVQELSTLLHKLVRERSKYESHLRKHLPPYVKRARKTADLLAERYYAQKSQG